MPTVSSAIDTWPLVRERTRAFGKDSDFTRWKQRILESAGGGRTDAYIGCTSTAPPPPVLMALAMPMAMAPPTKRRRTAVHAALAPPAMIHGGFASMHDARRWCLSTFVQYLVMFRGNSSPLCTSFCFEMAVIVCDHVLALVYNANDLYWISVLCSRDSFTQLAIAVIWSIDKVHGTMPDLPADLCWFSRSKKVRDRVCRIEARIVVDVLQWRMHAVVTPLVYVLDWFEHNVNCFLASFQPRGEAVLLRRVTVFCDLYYCNRVDLDARGGSGGGGGGGASFHPECVAIAALMAALRSLQCTFTTGDNGDNGDNGDSNGDGATRLLAEHLFDLYNTHSLPLRVTRAAAVAAANEIKN